MRFQLNGPDYLVEEVIDQWYGPDDTFFKVRADDRNPYILRRNTRRDEWTLESFRRLKRLVGWRIAGRERLLGRFVDGSLLFGSSHFRFGLEPVVEFRTWFTASLDVEFVSSPPDSIFKRERLDRGFLCVPKCRHGSPPSITLAYGIPDRRAEAPSRWDLWWRLRSDAQGTVCKDPLGNASVTRRREGNRRPPVSREAPRIIFRPRC